MSVSAGPFAYDLFHLIFLLSALLAIGVAWWLGKQHQLPLADSMFRTIAFGLIVARFVFVGQYFELYIEQPWQILNIRDGGFNAFAGLIAGAIWGYFELRKLPAAKLPMAATAIVATLVTAGVSLLIHTQVATTEFPVTQLTQMNGEPIHLPTSYADTPVVMNIWATWCPPCVREMPLLEQAAEKWPNVAIVAVNQGENVAQIEAFLAEQGLNLPQVLLDEGSQISREIGVQALPTTLFFHADGTLSHSHVGEFSAATLENAIRQLR